MGGWGVTLSGFKTYNFLDEKLKIICNHIKFESCKGHSKFHKPRNLMNSSKASILCSSCTIVDWQVLRCAIGQKNVSGDHFNNTEMQVQLGMVLQDYASVLSRPGS